MTKFELVCFVLAPFVYTLHLLFSHTGPLLESTKLREHVMPLAVSTATAICGLFVCNKIGFMVAPALYIGYVYFVRLIVYRMLIKKPPIFYKTGTLYMRRVTTTNRDSTALDYIITFSFTIAVFVACYVSMQMGG
jgi:hypothetical protein